MGSVDGAAEFAVGSKVGGSEGPSVGWTESVGTAEGVPEGC